MKVALCILKQRLDKKGLCNDFVGNMHDEYVLDVPIDQAEEVAEMAVQAIRDAGEYFKLNVPLDGNALLGKSWAEVH